jgi:hypothetical protein
LKGKKKGKKKVKRKNIKKPKAFKTKSQSQKWSVQAILSYPILLLLALWMFSVQVWVVIDAFCPRVGCYRCFLSKCGRVFIE